MLDGIARKLIDPALESMGRFISASGISANTITWTGFGIGLAAASAIATGHLAAGAAFIVVSRVMDGLDGVVARRNGASEFGGYLDIVLDFAFYGMVPAAFALLDPATFALPAAVLILSFYINGASFLAFAILAEKRKLVEEKRGKKSIFFTTGLAEATETLAVFILMCLKPDWFQALAYGFAAICIWTAANRIVEAWRRFA